MRIAYLDCFSGISGDMFLGALVDAGVPARVFEEVVAALDIGARLEISSVSRSGITATKVDVLVHGEKELPREIYWEQHDHKHAHEREQDHERKDEVAVGPSTPSHTHARGLSEIKRIISGAAISDGTKRTATAIFEALGAAEAKIHNTDIETIHFHEVGAVDAMVDIVCAAAGAEALGVDEWVCSPLNVGGGTVKCAHGTFPVPAPATVELLQDAPVYSSGLPVELVTPTGAAIVKQLANKFASFPAMKIEKTGYGAGTRDVPGHPNVLRLTMGQAQGVEITKGFRETVSVLEANLDDLNPQVFGYVLERLLEQGALDVFGVPVQMKKSRPGMLMTVLCRPEDAERFTQLIFCETSTLGVRCRDERREALQRKWINVATQWGNVRLKIGSFHGTVTNYFPEYEDCRRIATEHQVPLKNVMQEAVRQYLEHQEEFATEDTKINRR
jgi:uncharacterized protein (TIGR00299 family) protein